MAYEKAGVELELSKAEAYISNAKQAAAATDLLFSSISKIGGVNIQGLNAFSSNMKDLVKVGQDAGKSAQQAAIQIVEVGAKASSSSNHFGDLIGKVKDVATGLMSMGANAAGKAASGLLEVGKMAGGAALTGIQKVGEAAFTAGKKLLDLGIAAGEKAYQGLKKVADVAVDAAIKVGKLAIAGGTALAGLAGAGTKAAGDLQESINNISTIKPDIDTSAVFKSLNEMQTRVPASAKDLADSLYNIFSSIEINQADAVALVEKFAQGALGAQTDADTWGTAMLGIMNAYGKGVGDVDKIQDVFFNTINKGVINGKQLASALGPVTASAKSAGLSIEDLGAAIVGVTKEGGDAAQNVNNLNNYLMKVTTKDAQAAMNALGIKTVDATGKFRPFNETLGDLKIRLAKMTEAEKANALQAIFPDAQARQGAIVLMSQLDAVNESLALNQSATGSARKAFEAMVKGFNVQAKLLKNTVLANLMAIGAGLLPVLTPVLAKLNTILKGTLDDAEKFGKSLGKALQDGFATTKKAVGDFLSGWDLFKASFTSGFEVPPTWTGLAATMARLGEALSPLKAAFADLVKAIMPEPAIKFSDSIGGVAQKAKDAHPVIDAISSLVKNVLVPGIEGAAKTIDNMQLAFSKLQGVVGPVLPQLGDLALKAWDIYQAISPLNIGLDVFNGIMTGGLGGGIDAVGQHVTDLGQAFGVDLSGPVSTVTGFLKTDLIPAVESIAKGFGDALPGIIEFGQGILNQVLPPVQSFIGWVGEHVGPVVQSAFNTFQTDVLPALQRFAGFIGETVLPKVTELIGWVDKNVRPILEKGFGILSETVIPTLGKLVGVITDDVMPILFSWWNIIGTALKPILEGLATVVGTVVLPAIEKIWGFINDPLIPIFKKIAEIVQDPVMKIFQDLANLFNGAVKAAIDAVVKVWDGLIDTIKKGAEVVGKVAAGDWAGAWDVLTNTAKTGAQDTVKEIDKIATTIANKDYSASAAAAGKTISQGMAAGINQAAGDVVAAAKSIAQKAINQARSTLSSQSPSKVFIGIGEDVGAGFAIGLDNNSGLVVDRMVDLVGNTNRVIEDTRDLFRWNINEYFSPVSDAVHDLDETNPIINATLKEMLKGFSQTVVDQAGGFKTALDGFISPVGGISEGIAGVGPRVKQSLVDLTGTMGKVIDEAVPKVEEGLKPIPEAVEKTGQDVAGAGSGSNSPAGAMQSVLDSVSKAVDAGTSEIIGKLQALLAQINALLSQIGHAVASLPAMGGGGGGGSGAGQGSPGNDMPGGNRMANPTGGGSAGGGGGTGSLLPSPASAQQVANFYSSSSTTSNAPVVINNNPVYNMPLNVAPLSVGTINQGYTHAMAMLPK